MSVSNRGHYSTGQSSISAPTKVILAGSSLPSSSSSFWCDPSWKSVMFLWQQWEQDTFTNIYLQEMSLFVKQMSTCSGNASVSVTSLRQYSVMSKLFQWTLLAVGWVHKPFLHHFSLWFILPSLKTSFDCQWTQRGFRKILLLQPSLFPVMPWMYIVAVKYEAHNTKGRPKSVHNNLFTTLPSNTTTLSLLEGKQGKTWLCSKHRLFPHL